MPDEPVVVVNTGSGTGSTEPPPAPAIVEAPPALVEDEEQELDLVARMVAEESIVREEQHEELMEAIGQWETRMQELLTLQNQTENPMLTEIRQQITVLQSQIELLRNSMATPPPNPPQSRSTKTEIEPGSIIEPIEPEDQKGSSSPAPSAPATRRPRFRKL